MKKVISPILVSSMFLGSGAMLSQLKIDDFRNEQSVSSELSETELSNRDMQNVEERLIYDEVSVVNNFTFPKGPETFYGGWTETTISGDIAGIVTTNNKRNSAILLAGASNDMHNEFHFNLINGSYGKLGWEKGDTIEFTYPRKLSGTFTDYNYLSDSEGYWFNSSYKGQGRVIGRPNAPLVVSPAAREIYFGESNNAIINSGIKVEFFQEGATTSGIGAKSSRMKLTRVKEDYYADNKLSYRSAWLPNINGYQDTRFVELGAKHLATWIEWYLAAGKVKSEYKNIPINNSIQSPPELRIKPKYTLNGIFVDDKLSTPETYIEVISSMNRNKSAKFLTFPDLSKPGKTEAVIEMTETTEDGYSQKATTTVHFNVEENRKITAIANPQEILLGSDFKSTPVKSLVKEVKFGDRVLEQNEYNVIVSVVPSLQLVGDKVAQIIVEYEKDKTQKVNIEVPVKVKWGSTIVVQDEEGRRVDASITFLEKKGELSLIANEGSGLIGGNIVTRPNVSVYRKDDTNRILFASHYTVYQNSTQLMNRYNEVFEGGEGKNLQYGDVFSMEVFPNNGVALRGSKTFISKSENLIRETEGYDTAFYELTKEGYRLLQFNQLTVINGNEVSLGTTKEEMNHNISKYIELPSHIENKSDYRMEFETVDTDTPGDKYSEIYVYQKLVNGGEFRTKYTVRYTVLNSPPGTDDSWIKVKLPTKVIYNSYGVKHEKIQSPEYEIENLSQYPLVVSLIDFKSSDVVGLEEKFVTVNTALQKELNLIAADNTKIFQLVVDGEAVPNEDYVGELFKLDAVGSKFKEDFSHKQSNTKSFRFTGLTDGTATLMTEQKEVRNKLYFSFKSLNEDSFCPPYSTFLSSSFPNNEPVDSCLF